MRAGIFAAGFGIRLQQDSNAATLKPLTTVAGRPLIDWVLSDLERAGVEDIVVIINDRSGSVRDHVKRTGSARVTWLLETTASSMHSFLRILEELADDGDEGPGILREAGVARTSGFNALRLYLCHLFDRGYRMSGVRMADSIDVDRPSDVATAEHLLWASLS